MTRPFPRAAALALAALLSLGVAGCALFDTAQRELIFRPNTETWRGYAEGVVAHEEVWIPVGASGERLHAWWVPAEGRDPATAPAMLYLHGARVNLTSSVYRIRGYARMGFNVLAPDYRGFGRSSERLPSEDSVYEDARAAWDWFAARVPEPRRRVIFGHSLGGAIAAELATQVDGAGALVLESTFTSIRDMAAMRAAFLPVEGLITQRFEVEAKMARVRLPVFIVHGEDDGVVPAEMAGRLFAAAREPKRLFLVPNAGHRAPMRGVGEELRRALFAATCAEPVLQRC